MSRSVLRHVTSKLLLEKLKMFGTTTIFCMTKMSGNGGGYKVSLLLAIMQPPTHQ